MNKLRSLGVAGLAGAALLLGGCIVAPPAYQQGYDPYGQPVYVQSAPVVVAPPAVSIGIGGFFGGGGYRGGYGGHGRGYYRGGGYWR